MDADDVVEQRAGRRLAALAHPGAGQRGAEIGTPEAGNGTRLGRHGHDAARRAGDQRHVAADADEIGDMGAEHAERAGIGVDQAGGDAAARGEAERFGRLRRQRAEIGADRARAVGQAAALQQIVEADLGQEVLLPAGRLMRQIGPFAGQRALRAGKRAGCAPGQEVGEVEKIAGFRPALRHVPLQPHQLRHRHFRRHDAADEIEHAVAGRRAVVGLRQRAVVEPDDRVPVVAARWSRPTAGWPSRSRTTSEQVASKLMPATASADTPAACARLPHRRADRGPDVVGIMLGMAGPWLLHRDRLFAAPKQRSVKAQNAGARAARAHIDGADDGRHRETRVSGREPRQQFRQLLPCRRRRGRVRARPAPGGGPPWPHASRRRRQRRACRRSWPPRRRPDCPR